MFKRIIQRISQLFTARQLATTSHDGSHPPETWPHQRSSGGGLTTGCGSQTQRPARSFPSPRLRVNADSPSQRRDEAPFHHSATRLLRDGHLQIGITGFHDSAFSVSIMGRDIKGLKKFYAEAAPGELAALINSSGLVEIFVFKQSARTILTATRGEVVRISLNK